MQRQCFCVFIFIAFLPLFGLSSHSHSRHSENLVTIYSHFLDDHFRNISLRGHHRRTHTHSLWWFRSAVWLWKMGESTWWRENSKHFHFHLKSWLYFVYAWKFWKSSWSHYAINNFSKWRQRKRIKI